VGLHVWFNIKIEKIYEGIMNVRKFGSPSLTMERGECDLNESFNFISIFLSLSLISHYLVFYIIFCITSIGDSLGIQNMLKNRSRHSSVVVPSTVISSKHLIYDKHFATIDTLQYSVVTILQSCKLIKREAKVVCGEREIGKDQVPDSFDLTTQQSYEVVTSNESKKPVCGDIVYQSDPITDHRCLNDCITESIDNDLHDSLTIQSCNVINGKSKIAYNESKNRIEPYHTFLYTIPSEKSA
jgi:hypothetical protein